MNWDEIPWGPWPEGTEPPRTDPDAEQRRRLGLPATLRLVREGRQPLLFDPALKHHSRAMRAGPPRFLSPATEHRWSVARRRALDHLVAAVAESPWADHLVLRGSLLLRAWYGDAAREPHDLDFVVVPASFGIADDRAEPMLDDLARRASDISRRSGDVLVSADGAVRDDIWTYDRVPGRRLVLPWRADGLPEGTVQLDFVFNEPLPVASGWTPLPPLSGDGVASRVQAATPELSLAWKVMWLLDDMYPQGKDLYDALLLSADTSLDFRLLAEVLVAADPSHVRRLPTLDDVKRLRVDWPEFQKEHPELPGTETDAHRRLVRALTPTFTADHGLPADHYARRAELLGPRIAQYAPVLASEGADAVLRRMALTDRLDANEAAIVLNELLHRAPADVPATLDVVLTGYGAASSDWSAYLARYPEVRTKILNDLVP
ncbi:nucleotidyl transferase AbiEii/AbiGii toxin family protein [Actinomadura rayongensis]|uniref:nucleotidyl transferase AbiEii/AbiGii toxin family protein n=1 Tax=Actinomadura rayongensis TaxID=1429076 RepID=UPI0019281A4A|nr:nucleotidyl transferase AbiEii/AbiGii toxin family protein [Actinomadura rayongensis]